MLFYAGMVVDLEERRSAQAATWVGLAYHDPKTFARQYADLTAIADERSAAEIVASTLGAARHGWR